MAAEFLQCLHKYRPGKSKIAGWYASEKLDGLRVLWDGGLSRGLSTYSVPFANLDKKVKPIASGLWTKYGNVVVAPDWFLNQLPPFPLDGELWAGRGNFEKVSSITRKDKADPKEWEIIEFPVVDSPSLKSVFGDRILKNVRFKKTISYSAIETWMKSLDESRLAEYVSVPEDARFEEVLVFLRENIESEGRIFLHRQIKLSEDLEQAEKQLERFFKQSVKDGAEGVVVRNPRAVWTPDKSHNILKYKAQDDAEGIVRGFVSGDKTDKGSKHLGKIGSLILDFGGKRVDCSGLTDDERLFGTPDMAAYAAAHPKEDMPVDFFGKHFRPGQQITFTYHELTAAGIPENPRYFRHRSGD
jgi:DNA ligase 1